MKLKKFLTVLAVTLAGILLYVVSPFFWLCCYIGWTGSRPTTLPVDFPEGTQIIEKIDTHQGFFREKGVTAVAVQIPPESRQLFAQQLREADFSESSPSYVACEALETLESAAPLLEAERVLWTFYDDTVIFTGDPFSDYFAAAYDEETGLCCYVEYDE